MSFSVRFGRTRFGRFLSLDNFHRDPFIQNVASTMVGDDAALTGFEPIVEEIKRAYTRQVPDMRDRVREMRSLFRNLCTRLCPEAHGDDLCPRDREEEQVSRILDSKDMKGGLKYADPALIAGTRPVGPITDRQKEILRDGMKKCGYSSDVERAVLGNRVGKAELDALTKAEATQMIAYLRRPVRRGSAARTASMTTGEITALLIAYGRRTRSRALSTRRRTSRRSARRSAIETFAM